MNRQRILSFLTAFFMMFGLAAASYAMLIDNGDGTITDDSTHLMWLQDANLAGGMDWYTAVAWADGLSYAGHDDWRLPTSDTCFGFNCTGSEMGYMYYSSLGNSAGGPLTNTGPFGLTLQPYFYWSGTEYAPTNPNVAWVFFFNSGEQTYTYEGYDYFYAWAVRPAAVPEPGTLFLLGAGLSGLLLRKRV